VVPTNAVRYQTALICWKRRGPEANGTTQTHCNSPIAPLYLKTSRRYRNVLLLLYYYHVARPFLGTLHECM